MADSSSECYFKSDTLGLRHKSSSFFNISGFFVGFGSKSSLDSDSVRSPTSPLDFSFFSNLANPFSLRSPRLLSPSGHQKKWDSSKVGLGIIDLLADETKSPGEVLDSPLRKNIIFGPLVKAGNSPRSNSLPRNYIISQLSPAKSPNPLLGKSVSISGDEGDTYEGDTLEPKASEVSSLISLTSIPNLSQKKSCPEKRTSTIKSQPLVIDGGSQMENFLVLKPSSLPIPIGSSHGHVGSLSAREIELSEDYTCVISHGPNPKTTHIFGDYILECHPNDLSSFGKIECLEIELPHEAEGLEGSTPYPSDEFLSFCYSCKKKLEEGDDIFMYRGEKAFCSFDCRTSEMFAEEEMEKTDDNSSKSSPETSYHEDLFLMGLPIAS